MSKILINLDNKAILDTGETVVKYPMLIDNFALNKKPLNQYKVLCVNQAEINDIVKYNRESSNKIEIYNETDYEGPKDFTYEWNIPDEYKNISIEDICIIRLSEMDIDLEKYVDRLYIELNLIKEKNMDMFFKSILYVCDEFKKNNVIWGGRGSSNASLIAFLLKINRVDPVKYNIDYKEFFK